jgi:hypothetical protein
MWGRFLPSQQQGMLPRTKESFRQKRRLRLAPKLGMIVSVLLYFTLYRNILCICSRNSKYSNDYEKASLESCLKLIIISLLTTPPPWYSNLSFAHCLVSSINHKASVIQR